MPKRKRPKEYHIPIDIVEASVLRLTRGNNLCIIFNIT